MKQRRNLALKDPTFDPLRGLNLVRDASRGLIATETDISDSAVVSLSHLHSLHSKGGCVPVVL